MINSEQCIVLILCYHCEVGTTYATGNEIISSQEDSQDYDKGKNK